MKPRKHLASIVGICSILSTLGGCQQETPIAEPTTTIQTTQPTLQTKSTTTLDTTNIQHQQLVIHPRCIGCGKCARFAPTNFTMNGRQAQVISQENLDSSAVQQAVARCEAQVIEIVEA